MNTIIISEFVHAKDNFQLRSVGGWFVGKVPLKLNLEPDWKTKQGTIGTSVHYSGGALWNVRLFQRFLSRRVETLGCMCMGICSLCCTTLMCPRAGAGAGIGFDYRRDGWHITRTRPTWTVPPKLSTLNRTPVWFDTLHQGQTSILDNPIYWEGNYLLVRTMFFIGFSESSIF